MDNNKINQMLLAANGANHVGEYPAGSYSPMPNKVGTVHAVSDLLEILELHAQLENICTMHTEAVVKAEQMAAKLQDSAYRAGKTAGWNEANEEINEARRAGKLAVMLPHVG